MKWRVIRIAVISCLLPLCVRGQEVLTWRDCVKEALKNNSDLRSSALSVDRAAASVDKASGVRLPQLSAGAGASRSGSEGADSLKSYSMDLSASQLIYDGGQTGLRIDQARENLGVSGVEYKVSSAAVRLQLRNAFADLFRSQELIRITRSILGRREQSMRLIKLRYEAGREHKGSMATSEAKYSQASVESDGAVRGLEIARRRLCQAMGVTNRAGFGVQGAAEVVVDRKQKPDFEKLADEVPQVMSAALQKSVARLGVESARAEYYPSVQGRASAGRSASEWPPEDDSWSVGVSFSLPIFDGWQRSAGVRQAKAALEIAEMAERSERDAAATALASRWNDLVNAVENFEVSRKFASAAMERSKIAGAQYSSGQITFDNWIIIEDDMVQTEKALLDAQIGVVKAEAGWINAKGGTLEDEK